METFEFVGLISRYEYQLADLGLPWNEVGGCYIFAKANGGRRDVLRVGKCDSFKSRPMPPRHECWAEAVRDYGATHLFVRVVQAEAARSAEEQDLVAAYNPPMNVQHRSGLAGLPALPPPGLIGLGLINQGDNRTTLAGPPTLPPLGLIGLGLINQGGKR